MARSRRSRLAGTVMTGLAVVVLLLVLWSNSSQPTGNDAAAPPRPASPSPVTAPPTNITLTTNSDTDSPEGTSRPRLTVISTPITAAPGCDLVTSEATIDLDELPGEAFDTLELIDEGGPFPYRQDGAVFENRERELPREPRGYYQEYTVETPGSDDRGARRIVAGDCGDLWYTDDHYDSFELIEQVP